MKYSEIIADNLKKAGWSYGYVSSLDSRGRTIWITDAHRGDGKRFVAYADDKLTAFVERETAVRSTKDRGLMCYWKSFFLLKATRPTSEAT